MWIVRLALRRTYTFVVVALLIAVLGAVSIYRMSTDIFPEIDIPVVSVVWQYSGMPADEVETRIVLINERVLTASVNDIEHIESQSLDGVGVIRIYFQPGAKVAEAEAQVTATCQTLLKIMPPGITPPYIVRYSATSVPVLQIAMSSDTLTEQQIFDYTSNFVIQRLGTVQGARIPQPYGGVTRQVISLGSAHRGTLLERAVSATGAMLSRAPETRPVAHALEARSAGVKDLGYGYVVDEDWQGHDPDAFWNNTGTVVPFLKSANHYFLCATLSRDAGAPVGRMLGDMLVLPQKRRYRSRRT